MATGTSKQRSDLELIQQHPFQLHVILVEGRNLAVRDRCGTSDPYVKFKIGGTERYRSLTIFKNLNPKWNEEFSLPIEDIDEPVKVKVYDHDRGLSDDRMGWALIDLRQLVQDTPKELVLMLKDKSKIRKQEDLGCIIVKCTLHCSIKDRNVQESERTEEQLVKSDALTLTKRDTDYNEYAEHELNQSLDNTQQEETESMADLDNTHNDEKDNNVSSDLVRNVAEESNTSPDHSQNMEEESNESLDHMQNVEKETEEPQPDTGRKDQHAGFSSSADVKSEPLYTTEMDHHSHGFTDEDTENESESNINTVTHLGTHLQDDASKLDASGSVLYLEMVLKEGRDLAVRDRSGTSDPYVKFKIGKKVWYKSNIVYKNLNPTWNEKFSLPIESTDEPIKVKVYDHDRGLTDDRMGWALIHLNQLERDTPEVLTLELEKKSDKHKHEHMGYIIVQCTLCKNQDYKVASPGITDRAGRKSVLDYAEAADHDSSRPQDDAKTTERNIQDKSITGHQLISGQHGELKSHSFFQLDVHLKEGYNLAVRDRSGTSDPYVRFKIGGKEYHKSRTVFKDLNPKWNEHFSLPIENVYEPIEVKVYDYDRKTSDDRMGWAEVDLQQLEIAKPRELKLDLKNKYDKHKHEYLGCIVVECTLIPKTQEDKELYLKKYCKPDKRRILTVVLLEAKNLKPTSYHEASNPYCKLYLGTEKCKSKVHNKTQNPKWLEQFEMNMFDNQAKILELSVRNRASASKDDFIGRTWIDVTSLPAEETHVVEKELDDGAGVVKLLLTITGICDHTSSRPSDAKKKKNAVHSFSIANWRQSLSKVGHLQVKVIKAEGLASSDIGGKSDPYCALELVNTRLRTQIEYKTLNPVWGKLFTFDVNDCHSVLEITVFDEDKYTKSDTLGKIAIPLLRIKSGERKWYSLKNKNLTGRAKGAILLEMDFVYNNAKAVIQTFKPKEEKHVQPGPKFKFSTLKQNLERVTTVMDAVENSCKFIDSCLNWESQPRSAAAFAVFLFVVWNFEMYMLPVPLLCVFFYNFLAVYKISRTGKSEQEDFSWAEEEDEDEDEGDEENKFTMMFNLLTFIQQMLWKLKIRHWDKHIVLWEEQAKNASKLEQIHDVCLQVQEGLNLAASICERIKNIFNWTVPWLSWVAVATLSAAIICIYFIPIRLIIMAWGINLFTKKLLTPNANANIEVIDFLSRVPSDKELIMYRELPPE